MSADTDTSVEVFPVISRKSIFVPSERSAFWPMVNHTLVERSFALTTPLSVALPEETEVGDPLVTIGTAPRVVNDREDDLVSPIEFVAATWK